MSVESRQARARSTGRLGVRQASRKARLKQRGGHRGASSVAGSASSNLPRRRWASTTGSYKRVRPRKSLALLSDPSAAVRIR